MLKSKLSERIGISHPIFLAGMAGGPTTSQLVAAVSEAGALGTLGAGYLSPEQLRTQIREIRALTDRPFAVNLFVPQVPVVSREAVDRMQGHLDAYRAELGIKRATLPGSYAPSFDDQLQVLSEECVPAFSFTFGIPATQVIQEFQSRGVLLIGSATTVDEAVELERRGIDIIVAQGSEAGGHRGTFLGDPDGSLVGTLALVPQVVDRVQVPVVAAGGVMDGRGLAACLALGAAGVQMGTAFLVSEESGAHQAHQAAVLEAKEDQTAITRAYSGRAARGIQTRFMREMRAFDGEVPDYPVQNVLTRDIRQAASLKGETEYMSLWAGQGLRMAARRPAGDIVRETVRQAEVVLASLTPGI